MKRLRTPYLWKGVRSLAWAAVLLLVGVPVPAAPEITRDEMVARISENVMCTCGCPHILNQCGDECGVAPQRIQELVSMAGEGHSEEKIYTLLEEKYGAAILAVPKAEGFNLLAWVAPFLGLFLGAALVFVVIRNLKPAAVEKQEGTGPARIDDRYRRMLDEQLRER